MGGELVRAPAMGYDGDGGRESGCGVAASGNSLIWEMGIVKMEGQKRRKGRVRRRGRQDLRPRSMGTAVSAGLVSRGDTRAWPSRYGGEKRVPSLVGMRKATCAGGGVN